MKTKVLVVNAIIGTIYAVASLAILPLAFGAIQLRLGEMLNHLIVYNKKFFYGILIGVFITNLFSAFGIIDVVFGVMHTLSALVITMIASRFIQTKWKLMLFNSFIFSAMMWIIALLIMAGGAFSIEVFFITWGGLFLSEFIVMTLAIPIWKLVAERLSLSTIFEEANRHV